MKRRYPELVAAVDLIHEPWDPPLSATLRRRLLRSPSLPTFVKAVAVAGVYTERVGALPGAIEQTERGDGPAVLRPERRPTDLSARQGEGGDDNRERKGERGEAQ